MNNNVQDHFPGRDATKSTDPNNIVIEDEVSNFSWELTRQEEVKKVNGAVLAVLVSIALESGWKFPSGAKAPSNFINLQLLDQLPEYFDATNSKMFCGGAMKLLLAQDQKDFGAEGIAFYELLEFINKGAFNIRRIKPKLNCLILDVSDNTPPLAIKLRVISLEGEGELSVNLPDSILDRWGVLEGANIYLYGIIPDETKHKEILIIEKSAWEKASQVLRYFSDSSDDIYEDQFKKVLGRILESQTQKITLRY